MHELQRLFATQDGEERWTQDMHALFGAGAFDQAEALLAAELAALDTDLAWTCLELPREAVVLSGWEEMGEAIALHEGDPVTGVTIAIANQSDRDFAKGAVHRPHIILGLYTDEAFAFSGAEHWQVLDECHAEHPEWAGKEEDIEIHMEIDGLDPLNTQLAHHKQRHFFRDDAPAAAPLRYVEFVLGCWWRALRWHQAVATECAIRGLPGAIPVIAGMVDMRPEVVAIHETRIAADQSCLMLSSRSAAGSMAEGFGAGFIQRKVVADEPAPPSVSELRRRAQGERSCDGEVMEKPQRTGILARLFGRR